MVVSDAAIHNIMGGIENTGDVRLHNHRRKLKQRFDIVKKLGQGTYGKVQLGINKETGQEVAIKTIRKCKIETEADLIRIRREIQIMSSVRHPNIIHIYEVFENREKMVLVMEYAAGGELYDYLSERKVLAEEEARRIFRQIATAVYYCHKHNICHRDLKLENILLDEVGNAKIADFGLSNVFSYSSLLSTFCGSPLYASPEIVKGTPYHGPEVDCWSLGVLLYTLVYGAMPFDGSNFKRLVKQISQGDYFEPKAPSPASPLISEMLNVNPARRADVSAICNHWWINEGYSEMCLDVAEELASLTPVRLDLLLSLNAPPVNSEKIVVDSDKATANAEMNGAMDRPVRSHSMGSIPPQTGSTTPFTIPEMKESVQEDRKSKIKKKEHSHSKTRRKERSRSRSRKSDNRDSDKSIKNRDEKEKTPAPLVNSETQIITKTPNEMPSGESAVEEKIPPEKEPVAEEESKPKLIERRKSKVFEVAEKFNAVSEKPAHKTSPPPKKIILPGINVDGARKEFERRTSLVNDTTLPKKQSSTSPSTPEDTFPLASTVALNKLVECAFKDEPPFENVTSVENSEKAVENEPLERVKTATKVINNTVSEGSSKAATLPRRKTSRAEIQLVTPQFPPDSFKTEVEHFVNKPTVNHKTEVVFPVSAPLPPKPLTKQDNQSKEHIIPIQIDPDVPRKISSPLPSWSSKSSIPRTSSSSLSRQSTVDSDSGSTISTGEPIRKSPREVIIPIAVEGGGYVTPSENTLTRMSSVNESEDDNRSGSRCFTLRSTKRRQPEQSQTAQLDTTDSLSSDEDDNFQLLTAENLFSTLLSRVRSLTQRLNHDEMRRSSAFPRSLFTQHSSLFDNLPSRRLTETRSFSRPESAPWRRGFSNSQPRRENSIKKRYSIIGEENHLSDANTTVQAEKQNETSVKEDTQKIKAKKSYEKDSKITVKDSINQDNAKIEKKFRRDFSIPLDLSAKQNTGKKLSIEEEFDKFFSKYRKPALDKYENSTSSKSAINLKKFTDSSGSCGGESKNESDDKLKAKPPRKSRFLRPDFYDTPAEESKYVIKNEKVRAFRERSLSRQREISKNLSVDSSSSNGMLNDYLRSRTCSLTDAIENVKKRDTYRRTISEDSKFDLSRSSSRSDAESDYKFQNTSNRKSLILQNELENEIRKTKNMNSKLSGLMMALNDNEIQYKNKLEKLYSTKSKSEEIKENETINGNFKEDHKEVNGTTEKEDCSKRSLLEKKFAYFKQLHDSNEIEEKTEKNEEQDNEVLNLKISTSMTSTTSFDNESSSLTTPTEEIDSDAWSVFSDGGESQYQDNINDRIRRRSFYSRFNIYKQKSLSNTQKSKPVAYSRSLSADYKHRSASNTRPT